MQTAQLTETPSSILHLTPAQRRVATLFGACPRFDVELGVFMYRRGRASTERWLVGPGGEILEAESFPRD